MQSWCNTFLRNHPDYLSPKAPGSVGPATNLFHCKIGKRKSYLNPQKGWIFSTSPNQRSMLDASSLTTMWSEGIKTTQEVLWHMITESREHEIRSSFVLMAIEFICSSRDKHKDSSTTWFQCRSMIPKFFSFLEI